MPERPFVGITTLMPGTAASRFDDTGTFASRGSHTPTVILGAMKRFAHRAAARVQLEMARRSTSIGPWCCVPRDRSRLRGSAPRPRPRAGASVFRDQLDHLARRYEVVPCGAPVAASTPDLPADGYRWRSPSTTTCGVIATTLRRRCPSTGLPATFFLTGRTLDGPDPFWWQDLQALADRRPRGLADVRDRLAPQWPWAPRRRASCTTSPDHRRAAAGPEGRRGGTAARRCHRRRADPGLPSGAVPRARGGRIRHRVPHEAP